MKTVFLKSLLIVACTAVMAPAHAGNSPVIGAGALSCAKYLELRKAGDAQTVALANVHSWAQGFISGMNAGYLDRRVEAGDKGAALFAQPDPASIDAHLERYCAKHLQKNVVSATTALWTTVRKSRMSP